MRYVLSNSVYEYPGLPNEIDRFCETVDDLESADVDIESITDWYDMLTGAVYFHAEHDYGEYDLEELENNYRKDLMSLADRDNHNFDILCSEIDDENNVLRTARISLSSYIKFFVEERLDIVAPLCRYVESSLEEYVENSTWHWALRNKQTGQLYDKEEWPIPKRIAREIKWVDNAEELSPIVWFGPDDTDPLAAWTIESALGQLFENNDTWTIIQSLLVNSGESFNECFLIWYTGEIVCSAPDIEEIISRCPVHFSMADDDETVKRKIIDFFLEQQTI